MSARLHSISLPLFLVFGVTVVGCGGNVGGSDGAVSGDSASGPDLSGARLDGGPDLAGMGRPDLVVEGGPGGDQGGGDDGAMDLGGTDDAMNPEDAADAAVVCGPANCANGCCAANLCTNPSMIACGTGGVLCQACDATIANACVNGVCRCGNGPACGAGQNCEAGKCVCNIQSCPNGCCNGSNCVIPSLLNCGVNGVACIACSKQADTCTNGVCTCGNGPACANGQACSNGKCICNINSCVDGCCAGDQCARLGVAFCGGPGVQCTSCDPMVADNCDGGTCACGMNPACGAGQHCVRGECVCDGVSCPNGCCKGTVCTKPAPETCGLNGAPCGACAQGEQCLNGACTGCAQTCKGCCNGDTCVDPPTASACGAGGGVACKPCDLMLADSCGQGGVCRCGGGAACMVGQQCKNGACECNPTSCPAGCCIGTVCMPQSIQSCGTLGAACVMCNTDFADGCVAGACSCGNGPACAVGQRCVNGGCICDAMSCPTGCCSGNVCNTPGLATCGTGGAPCGACDAKKADNCTNGACACGLNPPCSAGLDCVMGKCTCTATSCATGCCDANNCQPGNLSNACGSGGAACVACAMGTSCSGGACAGCAQTCNGCCSGNTCNMPSLNTCGLPGGACIACDPKLADGCDPMRGGCTCGGAAVCQTGQLCMNGTCICNAQSCANGCCSGNNCLVGVNCATCKSYHQSCTKNTDCCSANCTNGTCGVPVGQCLLANNPCVQNADCCSGHCDLDVDGKPRCTLPNQCKSLGSGCAQAADCCTLFCDPMAQKCSNAKVCVAIGQACTQNIECCGNLCQNKLCVNQGGCNNLGEACAGNNCCSMSCLGGHCFWDNWCRSMGDLCNANADCCNGVCDANKHRCDTTTQCVPTNEPCSGLRSCCNTLCVDNGLGLGVGFCYPIGGCRSYNDVCKVDKDCCSLKCGPADALGLRRCLSPLNCLSDGEVCGGQGASQNCCTGGKANCAKTVNGVSRCFGNKGMACYQNGMSCHFGQECCSGICLPDPNSPSGFSCSNACIPLGMGTCTTDSDCCQGGICQAGVCVSSGQSCVPLGGGCKQTADCCAGQCAGGFCSYF